MATSDGRFTGLDLGDNYPRGINFWTCDLNGFKDYTIYSYKTLHGDVATSPNGLTFREYTEISTDTKTFYKWSNDNEVYTEISSTGLLEYDDGYLVFFLGEKPALDNSLTGESVNVPRNLGFTKVAKDLNSKVSEGIEETGGAYGFNGDWKDLSNEGIQWLTDFQALTDTATRLKVMKLNSEYILLMFEIWDPKEYRHTAYMLVDKNGAPYGDGQVMELCYPLRLMK